MNKVYPLLCIAALLLGCGKPNDVAELEAARKVISDSRKLMMYKDLTSTINPITEEQIQDAEEIRGTCEEIMSHMGKGDFDSGFEVIKKHTWLPEKEINNALEGSKPQLELLSNRFGEFIGHEFVSEEFVSPSLANYVYLAKCRNHVLVFNFTFYKATDNWTLNNFYWNDNLNALVD